MFCYLDCSAHVTPIIIMNRENLQYMSIRSHHIVYIVLFLHYSSFDSNWYTCQFNITSSKAVITVLYCTDSRTKGMLSPYGDILLTYCISNIPSYVQLLYYSSCHYSDRHGTLYLLSIVNVAIHSF